MLEFQETLSFKIDYVGRKLADDSKSLLAGLLRTNCNERLGSSMENRNPVTSADDIRNHNFFESIDFEELRNRTLRSPFQPKVKYTEGS